MVSRQICLIRKQNRLSQQQLSDVLGISRSTYCSYETGRRKVGVEIIEKLSEFYGVSTDLFIKGVDKEYLNDEENYEGQPDIRFLSQLSRSERDLIVNLRCLDKSERETIKNLVIEKKNK